MNVDQKTPPNDDLEHPIPRDRLLLRMNHEIRNAVNATLGMTELLLESQLTPEQWDRVTVIRESTDQLLTESCRILDLMRAESGSLKLDTSRFDLCETLRQTLDLLSLLAGHRGIQLKTSLPDHLPSALIGDPMRISEILFAVVRVTLNRVETGEIFVSMNVEAYGPDAATISIRITHPGPCVPPGFMLDASEDIEDGVAVVLARRLARMMDGDLFIQPGRVEGVEFNLTVKLAVASAVNWEASPRAARQANGSDSRALRILVAEDALNNQMLVKALLRDEPWEVDVAENGRIAVEMASHKRFNLILMDLDMPEMDGYAATRQIRIEECLSQFAAVPIVALTAHNETEAVIKSFEAGCIAHVTKPFTRAVLIETIQQYAV